MWQTVMNFDLSCDRSLQSMCQTVVTDTFFTFWSLVVQQNFNFWSQLPSYKRGAHTWYAIRWSLSRLGLRAFLGPAKRCNVFQTGAKISLSKKHFGVRCTLFSHSNLKSIWKLTQWRIETNTFQVTPEILHSYHTCEHVAARHKWFAWWWTGSFVVGDRFCCVQQFRTLA